MTEFSYSLGLCVVLLVPEPATFALLLFTTACLVSTPLRAIWSAASHRRWGSLRPRNPKSEIRNPKEAQMKETPMCESWPAACL